MQAMRDFIAQYGDHSIFVTDPASKANTANVVEIAEEAGAKVAIEVTGNGAALNTVLDAVAPFARVALLGCTRDSNFTINYYRKVHAQGVSLIGAHTMARPDAESSNGWWTTRDDAKAFLKMLALGRISLDGFVAEVHSPAECGEVYSRLCAGGAFPVVQFDWTRLEG
jgi:threonine dehydrogenase-like Zn-dependent dehydrogenase